MSFDQLDALGVAPPRPNRAMAQEVSPEKELEIAEQAKDAAWKSGHTSAALEGEREVQRMAEKRGGKQGRGFGRAAAVGAINLATLPARLPAKAALALGSKHPAARLLAEDTGEKSIAEVESLLNDETEAQARERARLDQKAFPLTGELGTAAGEALGGEAYGALGRAVRGGGMYGAPAPRGAGALVDDAGALTIKRRPSPRAVYADGKEAARRRAEINARYEAASKAAAEGDPEAVKWLRAHTSDSPLANANRSEADGAIKGLSAAGKTYQGRVHRGDFVSDDEFQRMLDEEQFVAPTSLSASTRRGTAKAFDDAPSASSGKTRHVLYQLEQESGVPAGAVAKHRQEAEVTIPQGSQFQITRVSKRPKDVGFRPSYLVEGREVPAANVPKPGARGLLADDAGGIRGAAPTGLREGERIVFRVQPKGKGLKHRSELSSGELDSGPHVYVNPNEVEYLDGMSHAAEQFYGDEVAVIATKKVRANADVEGMVIDPSKSRVIARVPYREYRAADWEDPTSLPDLLKRYGKRGRSLLSDDAGGIRAPVSEDEIGGALRRQRGEKPGTLDYLRNGGKVGPNDRVRVEQYPDNLAIGNGRHRIALASERGEPTIAGDYVRYDADGSVVEQIDNADIPVPRGSRGLLADDAGGIRAPRIVDEGRAKLSEMYDPEEYLASAERFWAQNPAYVSQADAATEFLQTHPESRALLRAIDSNSAMNRELRGTESRISPDVKARAAATTRILEDAAKAGLAYRGQTARGLTLPGSELKRWIDSGYVDQKSMWSATADVDSVGRFVQDGEGSNVILRLNGKSGIPIEGVSKFPHEHEIAYPPGRKWKINGITKDANGRTVIDAEEVDRIPEGIDAPHSALTRKSDRRAV